MTVFLTLSGVIALITAAGHAFSGERFIVPNLDADTLPATPFGAGRETRTILYVGWHLGTVAFAIPGCMLLAAGTWWAGAAAEGGAIAAAAVLTGCVAVTLAIIAGSERSLRGLLTHPGPGLMIATAAVAWLGVASF